MVWAIDLFMCCVVDWSLVWQLLPNVGLIAHFFVLSKIQRNVQSKPCSEEVSNFQLYFTKICIALVKELYL